MTRAHEAWKGPRLVLTLYALLVALSAVFGYVIGLVRPADLDPRLFMLVELPPTPVGMALYGSLTVAVFLGVGLFLVSYVAREYDTVDQAE